MAMTPERVAEYASPEYARIAKLAAIAKAIGTNNPLAAYLHGFSDMTYLSGRVLINRINALTNDQKLALEALDNSGALNDPQILVQFLTQNHTERGHIQHLGSDFHNTKEQMEMVQKNNEFAVPGQTYQQNCRNVGAVLNCPEASAYRRYKALIEARPDLAALRATQTSSGTPVSLEDAIRIVRGEYSQVTGMAPNEAKRLGRRAREAVHYQIQEGRARYGLTKEGKVFRHAPFQLRDSNKQFRRRFDNAESFRERLENERSSLMAIQNPNPEVVKRIKEISERIKNLPKMERRFIGTGGNYRKYNIALNEIQKKTERAERAIKLGLDPSKVSIGRVEAATLYNRAKSIPVIGRTLVGTFLGRTLEGASLGVNSLVGTHQPILDVRDGDGHSSVSLGIFRVGDNFSRNINIVRKTALSGPFVIIDAVRASWGKYFGKKEKK